MIAINSSMGVSTRGEVSDANPQHGQQYHPERVEIYKGLNHSRKEAGERCAGEQVLHLDGGTRARIDQLIGELGGQRRAHPHPDQQQEKQQRRIGQPVTQPLYAVERAKQGALGGGLRHRQLASLAAEPATGNSRQLRRSK
jgi:hypothetical protein